MPINQRKIPDANVPDVATVRRAVGRKWWRAQAFLWLEYGLTIGFWPAIVVAVVLSVALLVPPVALSPVAHVLLVCGAGLAVCGASIKVLITPIPRTLDILRRLDGYLDRYAGGGAAPRWPGIVEKYLQHQAISTNQDEKTEYLWQRYKARLARDMGQLPAPQKRHVWARRDPFGVSVLVVMGVFVAVAAALGRGSGVSDLSQRLYAWAQVPYLVVPENPPYVQFTFTPPTSMRNVPAASVAVPDHAVNGRAQGMPPAADAAVPAPVHAYEGGRLQVSAVHVRSDMPVVLRWLVAGRQRLYIFKPPSIAQPAAAVLRANDTEQNAPYIEGLDMRLEMPLGTKDAQDAEDAGYFNAAAPMPTTMTITQGDTVLARLPVLYHRDLAPSIAWDDNPVTTTSAQMHLRFSMHDEYPMQAVALKLEDATLDTLGWQQDYPPIALVPVADGEGLFRATFDAGRHPLAGQTVNMSLVATDEAGKTGQSRAFEYTLPELHFSHPGAQAIMVLRKKLNTPQSLRQRVMVGLHRLAAQPAMLDHQAGVFLAISTAATILEIENRRKAIPEVSHLLLQAALSLEQGRTHVSGNAMQNRHQSLLDALGQGDRETMRAELARLQRAIQHHMQTLAKQTAGTHAAIDPKMVQDMVMAYRGNMVSMGRLQHMLMELQTLLELGAVEEARQLMARIKPMLDQLAAAKPMSQAQQQEMQALQQLQTQVQKYMQIQADIRDATQQRVMQDAPTQEEQAAVLQAQVMQMLRDRDFQKNGATSQRLPRQASPRQETSNHPASYAELAAQQQALSRRVQRDMQRASHTDAARGSSHQRDAQDMSHQRDAQDMSHQRDAQDMSHQRDAQKLSRLQDAQKLMQTAYDYLNSRQGGMAVFIEGHVLQALQDMLQGTQQRMQAMMQGTIMFSMSTDGMGGNGGGGLGWAAQDDAMIPENPAIGQAKAVQQKIKNRLQQRGLSAEERSYLEKLLQIKE
jgi:hypothetical protein